MKSPINQILEQLEEALVNILVAEVCVSDYIHDAKKTNEPTVKEAEIRYKFWNNVEKDVRKIIDVIKKELEK